MLDSLPFTTFILAAEALLIGLLATPHCVAMCGPFALAASRSTNQKAGTRTAVAYSLGRTTTYIVLCSLAGAVSFSLVRFQLVGWALSVLAVIAAALSVLGWLKPGAWAQAPARWLGSLEVGGELSRPFMIGLSTAFLPCGMVWAAVALALTGGHPLAGIAVGAAFGLGTSPALSFLIVQGGRFSVDGKAARATLAAVILVSGIGMASFRFDSGANPPLDPETGAPSEWICHPSGDG
jgi:sulfite exporter TauE/SafE